MKLRVPRHLFRGVVKKSCQVRYFSPRQWHEKHVLETHGGQLSHNLNHFINRLYPFLLKQSSGSSPAAWSTFVVCSGSTHISTCIIDSARISCSVSIIIIKCYLISTQCPVSPGSDIVCERSIAINIPGKCRTSWTAFYKRPCTHYVDEQKMRVLQEGKRRRKIRGLFALAIYKADQFFRSEWEIPMTAKDGS